MKFIIKNSNKLPNKWHTKYKATEKSHPTKDKKHKK